MTIYRLDPLKDPRWDAFLQRHPKASIFHSRNWLEALARTYGYAPIVFTTSSPGMELANGLACCTVTNWLSGRRLVSLPFSDHCIPLVENPDNVGVVLDYLRGCITKKEWDSVESRSPDSSLPEPPAYEKHSSFYFHTLNLNPSLHELFGAFHKDCIQRKLARAVRENLTYEEGTSDSLLNKFYGLLLLTRRRHGLPPQPAAWFRNLIVCLGDKVNIRVASKNGRPIASILTLQYKRVLVYKYGCSDQRFSNLGGTQTLLWKAIQEAKNDGLCELDMGRSDRANSGLVAFKDRWGGARSTSVYLRFPSDPQSTWRTRHLGVAKHVFPYLPDAWLAAAGRVLYKHMG
jgi:hypothetical protein